jgi:hypothetical protein
MNNLNALKKVLEVVIHADREFSINTPLYKIKSLFDGLQLDGLINDSTAHGELILVALSSKRVDKAMKHIVFARSSLEVTIKDLELAQAKEAALQETEDSLAIESTCIDVTRHEKKETQLQLENIPKKLGRPKSSNPLTSAERSKRARAKKKVNKVVTINTSLSLNASRLYNQLISDGFDLNSIVEMAHDFTTT